MQPTWLDKGVAHHQVCTPRLDDLSKLGLLGTQRSKKRGHACTGQAASVSQAVLLRQTPPQTWQGDLMDALGNGDVHSGRERIVGALAIQSVNVVDHSCACGTVGYEPCPCSRGRWGGRASWSPFPHRESQWPGWTTPH